MAVLCLFSSTSLGEPGSAADYDTPEDLALRRKDAKAVAEIRAHLVKTFLGEGSGISADQNEGMRQYIDWLMAPLENLVNEKGSTNNLRFKPIGGPTGSGKTRVSREFAKMAMKAGLLSDSRYFYQQGESDQSMELSIIDKLGLPDQKVNRDNSSNRYADVRARHVKTYAVVLFDEASHYGVPPKELEKAYQEELRALQEKVGKRVTEVQGYKPQTDKPTKPSQASFVKNIDGKQVFDGPGYELALLKHDSDLLEWELTESLQALRGDEKMEATIERLKEKYKRLRDERKEITRIMKMIWQAASGGKYIATEERQESEDTKRTLTASENTMIDFKAKYENSPLFQNIWDRFRQLSAREADQRDIRRQIGDFELQANEIEKKLIAERDAKQAELKEYQAKVDRKISDFSGLDARAIEAWMREKNMTDVVGHTDGRFPIDPSLVERMLKDIKENKSHYMTYDLGYREPPAEGEKPQSKGLLGALADAVRGPSEEDLRIRESAKKLREKVLEHYRNEKTEGTASRNGEILALVGKMQGEINALRAKTPPLVDQIKQIEAEIAKIKKPIIAFGQSEKEIKGLDPKVSREGLIKEYEGLLRAHDAKLRDAATSAGARVAIGKFIDGLDEYSLKEHAPEFWQRMRDMGVDIRTWLNNLKKSEDILVKYNQLLRMNPDHARALVYNAVMTHGFQSQAIDFGNVNVAMMMNYRPAEQKVNAAVAAKREAGEVMGFDELSKIYHDEVPPDWAERFFKDHFPTLFTDLMSGSDGNPQAVWRRLFGDTGAFFFFPMNTKQMVNSVETTMQAKLRAWQQSLPPEMDVQVELFVHENVPGLFVRDNLNAELGNNVVLEGVREAMNSLINELNRQVMEKPEGQPFHVKLALVNETVKANEGKPGGLQTLTLRYLPYDYESADGSKILRSSDNLEFTRDSTIATWSHTYVPSASLTADNDLSPKMKPVAVKIDVKKKRPPRTKEEAEAAAAERKRVADEAAAEKKRLKDEAAAEKKRKAEEKAAQKEKARQDAAVAELTIKQRAQANVEQELQAARDLVTRERQAMQAELATLKTAAVAESDQQRAAAAIVAENDRRTRWLAELGKMSWSQKLCLWGQRKISGTAVTEPPASFK